MLENLQNGDDLSVFGYDHQGVNSLADRSSLLKQTGGVGPQSSSEDFCLEPGTFSPRLSGQSGDPDLRSGPP